MSFSIKKIKPLIDDFEDPIYPVKVIIFYNGKEYEDEIIFNRLKGHGAIDYKGLANVIRNTPKVIQNSFREEIVREIFKHD